MHRKIEGRKKDEEEKAGRYLDGDPSVSRRVRSHVFVRCQSRGGELEDHLITITTITITFKISY